jgi:HAD superfamily hydrolase (TIGR01509 family)
LTARPPVGAAIFDCDGLLIDTAECWHGAFSRAAVHAGCAAHALLFDSLNGASVEIASQRLSSELDRRISSRLIQLSLEAEVAARPHVLLPGVRALLERLHGVTPLAIASNAPRAVVEAVLVAAGARSFFAEIITSEAVPAAKPSPDVYLEACLRLAVDPAAAVAFEDSELGAEAVRAAGIRLVYVPSQPGPEVGAEICAERLDDPRILRLFDLPLGQEMGQEPPQIPADPSRSRSRENRARLCPT